MKKVTFGYHKSLFAVHRRNLYLTSYIYIRCTVEPVIYDFLLVLGSMVVNTGSLKNKVTHLVQTFQETGILIKIVVVKCLSQRLRKLQILQQVMLVL